MGLMHDDREPQPGQTETSEPLVDLKVERPQPEETRTGSWLQRKRLSGTEVKNSPAQPQPPAKAHRRSLALGGTETGEPPVESQLRSEPRGSRLPDPAVEPKEQESSAMPGPRRARLVLDAPVAPQESPSVSTVGRSRGAVSHPCDDPPGLQNIIDPPQSLSSEPAPAPSDQTPEPPSSVGPAKVQQFLAELRAKQNLSMALIGGLAVAIIAATAWALITTATNYQIGWMAVGVGFLVGGAVRTLGQGVDKSFGYLGATMSVFGCLLGNLLSICTIVAGQEGLSLVAVLGHVCVKPALIPAAMIATFHPLDLLFYGIAVYEGYRFSFRQVTDAEISRALGPK